MELATENKNLTIRAHGFGFIFLLIMDLMFVIPAIVLIILFFIPNNEMYFNWFGLLICIITLLIWGYEGIKLFKNGKVTFINNKFITRGQNSKIFPAIKRDCKDFVSYKLTNKYLALCVEFSFTDGKKTLFHIMQFTKKQNLKILQEIKNRGGLNNIEITLKNK